ncbi:hypothetical protein ACHQM5_015746 [Ranunculus cassubicifolius]
MEGTRYQKIESSLKENDERVTELIDEQRGLKMDMDQLQASFSKLDAQFQVMSQGITELLAAKNKSSPPSPVEPVSSVLGTKPIGGVAELTGKHTRISDSSSSSHSTSNFLKLPKLDFPPFHGDNVRAWVHTANRYYQFHPIEENQKVLFASLHLHGRAENWYQSCMEVLEVMSWNSFTEAVRILFSEEAKENVVGEFKKLVQTASVEDYQIQFEALQPLVLQKNKGLSEAYFVECFVSGLKDEIKNNVQMFNPTTLTHAITLAKLQEATLASSSKSATAADEIAISLNALSGSSSYQTLRLEGTVRNQAITMLIDSDNTHNFLDINTTKKLNCTILATPSHDVSIAGGGNLQCTSVCPRFTWQL